MSLLFVCLEFIRCLCLLKTKLQKQNIMYTVFYFCINTHTYMLPKHCYKSTKVVTQLSTIFGKQNFNIII